MKDFIHFNNSIATVYSSPFSFYSFFFLFQKEYVLTSFYFFIHFFLFYFSFFFCQLLKYYKHNYSTPHKSKQDSFNPLNRVIILFFTSRLVMSFKQKRENRLKGVSNKGWNYFRVGFLANWIKKIAFIISVCTSKQQHQQESIQVLETNRHEWITQERKRWIFVCYPYKAQNLTRLTYLPEMMYNLEFSPTYHTKKYTANFSHHTTRL